MKVPHKNKRLLRGEVVESLHQKDINKITAKELVTLKYYIENFLGE